MKAKVTLTLDKELIEEAKEFAKASEISLSAIVGRYLRCLLDERQNQEKEQSAMGVDCPGMNHFDREHDPRDYSSYLVDWYQ